ncbi:type 1 glutamine amidotransferase [Allokutzneria sp. A3M-2-11 16]|uniref:type 1 glutamine amidotransferase n=1 Tax=Allokutzneria sp. A3M-2-11 16 TaxID=2962043 RepID=UPI0020B7DA06|nr:type 1 glutamine amidotransferase [Allokutzneria sp. A3M-2-11 16]MCP3801894.1 type 1 glutamine amidotransferase [Allokutzneria sp. A3M-2-11 16]
MSLPDPANGGSEPARATRLLVVQPSRTNPPGALADWLRGAGAELDVVVASEQPLPATLDGYQGVVCLGGEMSALDDLRYPWLASVRKLLADAVTRNVPTLAICLGAQLLAAATGGVLRPMEDGPEVGGRLVAKRDSVGTDPLFADLPWTPDVLQFHADEISSLPAGAQLLASSPRCQNQAFLVGSCGYGMQFHIETTTDMVLDWAASDPDAAERAPRGGFTREGLDQLHADLAETWEPFAQRFVRLAEEGPRPNGSLGRNLPLV